MTDAMMPSATDNANKQLIGTLLRSRLFRDYEGVFTKATGLSSFAKYQVLFNARLGNRLPSRRQNSVQSSLDSAKNGGML
jgi:hypothetical protein